jgi:hypothetical protein
VDVNVPGEIAMLVAPRVDQLSVLLEPGVIVDASEVKALIVGAELSPVDIIAETDELQPVNKAQPKRMRKFRLRFSPKDLSFEKLDLLLGEEMDGKIWLPCDSGIQFSAGISVLLCRLNPLSTDSNLFYRCLR